jgi:hypothetical protein
MSPVEGAPNPNHTAAAATIGPAATINDAGDTAPDDDDDDASPPGGLV